MRKENYTTTRIFVPRIVFFNLYIDNCVSNADFQLLAIDFLFAHLNKKSLMNKGRYSFTHRYIVQLHMREINL